jgi:hypothetical protein
MGVDRVCITKTWADDRYLILLKEEGRKKERKRRCDVNFLHYAKKKHGNSYSEDTHTHTVSQAICLPSRDSVFLGHQKAIYTFFEESFSHPQDTLDYYDRFIFSMGISQLLHYITITVASSQDKEETSREATCFLPKHDFNTRLVVVAYALTIPVPWVLLPWSCSARIIKEG